MSMLAAGCLALAACLTLTACGSGGRSNGNAHGAATTGGASKLVARRARARVGTVRPDRATVGRTRLRGSPPPLSANCERRRSNYS
jgi:hypothetical protein